jgi:transcriptional regulator with XRE-family HTH domain
MIPIFYVDFIDFRQAVGERIRELRVQQQITQEEMDTGDDGIPYRTMQNIESGKSNPNLKTMYRLARRLGIHPSELLKVDWE